MRASFFDGFPVVESARAQYVLCWVPCVEKCPMLGFLCASCGMHPQQMCILKQGMKLHHVTNMFLPLIFVNMM